MEQSVYVPYCGMPPVPGELRYAWNLDPVLIAGLLIVAIAFHAGTRRLARPAPAAQRAAFYAGWTIVAVMFISPICSLAVALFSARVGQHMILMLVAAPLVMLGRPQDAFAALLGRAAGVADGTGRRKVPGSKWPWSVGGASVAGLMFAAFTWFWHAPAPYDATLTSDLIYWIMHLSLFGSSLLLWHVLLIAGVAGRLQGVVNCLVASMQMGLLGAIITFAPRTLYESHLATTVPWGLTALQDQQLGGLIMWVPGGAVFLAAALALAASALSGTDAHPGDTPVSR